VFPVIAMGFAALVLLTTVFARLGRPRAG
jgi:hypothetical protein